MRMCAAEVPQRAAGKAVYTDFPCSVLGNATQSGGLDGLCLMDQRKGAGRVWSALVLMCSEKLHWMNQWVSGLH